jgi:phage terminase large subunit
LSAPQALRCQFPEKLGPLFEPKRYKVIYGGRGKGGSWGIARALLIKALEKPLRILCTREIQKTISESVHQLLCDQIALLGLGDFYKVTETAIEGRNGTLFTFSGLRQLDATKIKSFEGYDLVWVEEAESITQRSWDILIPTIRKDGSEIWVNFNPQLDSDETWVRFIETPSSDTVLISMSYRDNPWFPVELEKERVKLLSLVESGKRARQDYDNIWEGKPRQVLEGAIYANEIIAAITSKRIRPLPYDPLLKVHTIWDLGWNDSMSIGFCQRLHSEIRWIDFLEDSHKTYDWYAAEIKSKRYNLGKCLLPFDGRAKNPQTGLSAEQILRKLGMDAHAAIKAHSVEEGIKGVRLKFPQMYFDEVRCKPLIDHLRRYRRAIPSTTNEPQSPLHDEHSHAADMVRYAVERVGDMTNEEDKPLPLPRTGIV